MSSCRKLQTRIKTKALTALKQNNASVNELVTIQVELRFMPPNHRRPNKINIVMVLLRSKIFNVRHDRGKIKDALAFRYDRSLGTIIVKTRTKLKLAKI